MSCCACVCVFANLLTQIRTFHGSFLSVYYAQMCIYVSVLYIYHLYNNIVCFFVSLIILGKRLYKLFQLKREKLLLRRTKICREKERQTTEEKKLPIGDVWVSKQQVCNLINNTKKDETSDRRALGSLKVMSNYIISTLFAVYYANPAGLTWKSGQDIQRYPNSSTSAIHYNSFSKKTQYFSLYLNTLRSYHLPHKDKKQLNFITTYFGCCKYVCNGFLLFFGTRPWMRNKRLACVKSTQAGVSLFFSLRSVCVGRFLCRHLIESANTLGKWLQMTGLPLETYSMVRITAWNIVSLRTCDHSTIIRQQWYSKTWC